MVNDGDGPYFIFPMIAYICLWISMPAARTDEQKREMKGKPTSLDGYRSSDFDFRTEVREAAQSPAGQTFRRAGGIFLGTLLLLFGLGTMFTCVIIPSFHRTHSRMGTSGPGRTVHRQPVLQLQHDMDTYTGQHRTCSRMGHLQCHHSPVRPEGSVMEARSGHLHRMGNQPVCNSRILLQDDG